MTGATGGVVVVVPTFNRSSYLTRALGALLAHTEDDVGIVVVDDCSTDDTPQVLDDLRRRHPDRLHVVRTARNSGPAAARNLGWRSVTSAWVAFTDDDCVVTDGWVEALLDRAATDGVDIVQGRTLPDPAGDLDRTWYRTVTSTELDHRFRTCNLLLSRHLLEDVDGFDETFPFAGEDADCCWRALERGHRAAFADGALVHHAVRPLSLLGFIRMRCAWAGLTRFYARHPDARFLLELGFLHRRSHLTTAALLVVLAAAGRRSWRLAFGVFLVNALRVTHKGRGDGRRWRRRFVLALSEPAVNAAEIAAFGLASARQRTLVL